jgi:DNA-binding MarR family transcriptional regulator
MTPRAQSAEPEAATDELSGRLLEALSRIARSARRATNLRLTLGSLSALATIIDVGSIRPGDLAVREGVAPATLSRVIGALERDGYIERHPDPQDRRSAFLEATETGKREVAAVRRTRATVMKTRLAEMDEDRRVLLAAALPALEDLAHVSRTKGGAPRGHGTGVTHHS